MTDPQRAPGCEYLHWYSVTLHSDRTFLYRTRSSFNLLTVLMSTLHRLITDYEPSKRCGAGTMALAVFLFWTLIQLIECLSDTFIPNAQFLCLSVLQY